MFATSLPIISFSQMDYSAYPTITQQIPSTNTTQSQPAYLILATIIINDSGGTKVASDFTVNIVGKIVGKSFILASFQALPSPEIKIVSMQEGNYSLFISNVQGYEVSQQNECQGDIKPGEVKTCLITLNDDCNSNSTIPTTNWMKGDSRCHRHNHLNVQRVKHLDQTTQQCVPNIPSPPPQCPAGQALRPNNTTMCSKYTTTAN